MEIAISAESLALLEKAKAGDMPSFSALVRMYEERAIHVAYSFLGNMEDARDTAQEGFVKAYQSLGKFKGESQFATWLHRIIVNLCKDALRKKKVRRNLINIQEQRTEEEVVDPVAQAPSREPDSLKLLMDQELAERIHAAMDELPFQQKSVFALRYLEGMTMEEIAATLSLSVGAVKAHLWQAGQKMKKNLSRELGVSHES